MPDEQTTPDSAAPAPLASATGRSVLEVDQLTVRFGGLTALEDVTFHIDEGEILGLIGPNGAGKTTCFNAITGVYRPSEGDIRFRGDSLAGMKRYKIAQLGIARTFQNIRLFPTMTALENVLVGADARHRTGMLNALFRTPLHRREESEGHDRAMELLRFMGLHKRADELAANLSYGDQRRLEIARAMATQPQLLCLDEPAAGFNPAEKAGLMDLIRKIRDRGYTVLLIEHDMRLVMGVTDRIVVLEFGRKIAEGTPAEIRDNPAVIAAYLGVDEKMLLEVEGLCVNYGHIEAIRDISFGVPEGSITTLIGANGAGKSTTLKTISGLRKVRAGSIKFNGKDITGSAPYDRVKMGISQAPEGRGCFVGMTVRENLDMGAFVRTDRRTAAYREDMDRVLDLFPRLQERIGQVAGTLSGGEQQMVAMGRALMARPKLLLLDEPSMGLAPKLIQQIFAIIAEINEQGTTVLLVEQNAAQALKRSDEVHILESGDLIRSGTGAELAGDESVKAAYLGGDV